MPINPNIILGVKPWQIEPPRDPIETYGKSLALKGLMGQQELQGLQLQQARRGIEEEEETRKAFTEAGGDRQKTIDALLGRGLYKPAQALQKSHLEEQKSQGELMKHDRENLIAFAGESRKQLPTLNAQSWPAYREAQIQRAGSFLTPQMRQIALQAAQQMPEQYDPTYIRNSLVKADELFTPKMQQVDVGGKIVMKDMNPFTNPEIKGGELAKTLTPGEVQTGAHQKVQERIAQGQLGVAQAQLGVSRGNLATSQARLEFDKNKADYSQPFESTVGGQPALVMKNNRTGTLVDANTLQPITGRVAPKAGDAEQLAGGFYDRMGEAEKILRKVAFEAPGEQKPGLVESTVGAVPFTGDLMANVARSPERQQYRQAQEDWVRAKLRKESGAVIPDPEMEREIRVYFPQIGDSAAVVAQKETSRRTAAKAMRRAAGPAVAPTPNPRAPTAPPATPPAPGGGGAVPGRFLGFEPR